MKRRQLDEIAGDCEACRAFVEVMWQAWKRHRRVVIWEKVAWLLPLVSFVFVPVAVAYAAFNVLDGDWWGALLWAALGWLHLGIWRGRATWREAAGRRHAEADGIWQQIEEMSHE